MANVKFTGVEITGVRVKTFNYTIPVSGAGFYEGSVGLPTGYEEVGIGYLWYPDTSGDKIYFQELWQGLSTYWKFETEGSGNVTIAIRGIENLEYYGQALLNP